MALRRPLFPRPKDWCYEKCSALPGQTLIKGGSLLYSVVGYDCWDRECWKKKIRTYPPVKRIIDLRSLKKIAAGCCPPALMKDYIMQEGGEMAERDPVEEALKLHKRGYFGGGG